MTDSEEVKTEEMDQSFQAECIERPIECPLRKDSEVICEAMTCDSTDEARQTMLNRVASTDAYFKQQLRTDPDLTFSEKHAIASEILDKKPATFLERYGKHLLPVDLAYFEPLRGDYFVDFHLLQLSRRFDSAASDKKRVRNRRYEAMKRLISEGEYFSNEEMKKRAPLLFDEMIGQYQEEKDVGDASQVEFKSMSEFMLRHLQLMQDNDLYDYQKYQQEQQEAEEFDSDSDDDDDEEEEEDGEDKKLSDAEKLALKNQFLEIMQQRFLSGQDSGFSYRDVDNNEDYDSMDIIGRDEEDKYFADENSNSDSEKDVEFSDDS